MIKSDSGYTIFLSAPEEFLLQRTISATVKQVKELEADSHSEWEVNYYNIRNINFAELAFALSPSLFSSRTICIIDDAQSVSASLLPSLLALLKNLPENFWVILSFLGNPESVVAKKMLASAQQKHIISAITKNSDRLHFVKEEFHRLQRSVSSETAQLIIDMVGNDIADLAAAVNQLVHDCPTRIDALTITQYFHGRPEISGYDVAEAAISRDTAMAIETLRWALYHGVAPVVIADALADTMNIIIRLRSINSGSLVDKSRILGIPIWRLKKLDKNIFHWSQEQLYHAVLLAEELNKAVKGISPVPEYVLEQTITKISLLS